MGVEGKWRYRTGKDRVNHQLVIVKIFKNFEKYVQKRANSFVQYCKCFLCFSKESKTIFPKQFLTDLSVVSKRKDILFYVTP